MKVRLNLLNIFDLLFNLINVNEYEIDKFLASNEKLVLSNEMKIQLKQFCPNQMKMKESLLSLQQNIIQVTPDFRQYLKVMYICNHNSYKMSDMLF